MYHSMWAYLWDLNDDGIADSVRYLKNEVGLDGVSVALAYHTYQQLRPHRAGRKLLTCDTAALYYRPDEKLYVDTAIEPEIAPLVQQGNPAAQVAESCTAEGLDLVAWTVCMHNTHLAMRYPQYALQNAYGDNLGWLLCPGEDEVRAYILAVCTDLARNYGVSRFELEMCSFGEYGHTHYHEKDGVPLGNIGRYLYSLCFSDCCVARARERGLDVDGLRTWVTAQLDDLFTTGQPIEGDIESFVASREDLAAFQKLREELVASLVGEIKAVIGDVETAFVVFDVASDRWRCGANPASVLEHSDLLATIAYSKDLEVVESISRRALAAVDAPNRLLLGLQAYTPCADDAESLRAVVDTTRKCGVEQLAFYNYGIMPRPNLDWVSQCIRG